jgi:hypothetical protein
MRVKYADHEEVITAGDAYYLEPGHLPVMEGGRLVGVITDRDVHGVAGSLYAHYVSFIDPGVFAFFISVNAVMMASAEVLA